MKTYEATFGQYAIRVEAETETEAKAGIVKKFHSYKDGSSLTATQKRGVKC